LGSSRRSQDHENQPYVDENTAETFQPPKTGKVHSIFWYGLSFDILETRGGQVGNENESLFGTGRWAGDGMHA
jgi:hypothetical protein